MRRHVGLGELIDPGADETVEQRVGSERTPKSKFDKGICLGEPVARCGEVAQQVDAGGEKIGDHEDACRAALDAACAAVLDIGFGEFEEGGFEDGVGLSVGESGDELMQVVVGGGVPAAVRDHEDRGFHA